METQAQQPGSVAENTVEAQAPDTAAGSEGTTQSDATTALAAELAEARARADRLQTDYLYAQAEIDNVRKRALRQAEERLSAAKRTTLARFLGVLDNLQRALSYDDSEALRNGLQATLKGFESLLSAEQVTPVEVVGKPFDPRFAEAIAARDTDASQDGVVLEEAQRGYLLGGDLLRPALVIVGKSASDAQTNGE